MPTKLSEHTHNFGVGPDGEPVLRHEVVLGHASVAEGIIEWSKKKAPGTQFIRETLWGLTLRVIAGSEPHVHLEMNPARLSSFLTGLGPTTALCIIEWGISLTGPQNKQVEAVRGPEMEISVHIGQGGEEVILYRYGPADGAVDENILLGAMRLTESGFYFFSREEIAEASTSNKVEEVKPEEKPDESFVAEMCDEDVVMTVAG